MILDQTYGKRFYCQTLVPKPPRTLSPRFVNICLFAIVFIDLETQLLFVTTSIVKNLTKGWSQRIGFTAQLFDYRCAQSYTHILPLTTQLTMDLLYDFSQNKSPTEALSSKYNQSGGRNRLWRDIQRDVKKKQNKMEKETERVRYINS